MFRVILAAFVLLLVLPQAEAQRGGRSAPKRPSSKSSKYKTKGKKKSDFVDRLWYGAGGTLNFSGSNGFNVFSVGLLPQVGYKFNDWLSAGPRFGATYTGIKGQTEQGRRDRVNLWDFDASVFARGRISSFFIQSEVGIQSQNQAFVNDFGQIVTEGAPGFEPSTSRENQSVLLIGAGYNGSFGGLGSEIGLFYNLFDDVDSFTSPVSLRVLLTLNY